MKDLEYIRLPFSPDHYTFGGIEGRKPLDGNHYNVPYFFGGPNGEDESYASDGSYLNPEGSHAGKFEDIARLIASYVHNGKVLDIGSGPGHLKYWMDKIGNPSTVVNADLSKSLLQSVHNLNREFSVVATVDTIPFADGSFQAVLFSDVLEHVWPHQALEAIREAKRTLVEMGWLFVNIPNRNTWINDAMAKEGHVWLPSVEELLGLFELGGFSNVQHFTRGFPESAEYTRLNGSDLRKSDGGLAIRAWGQK